MSIVCPYPEPLPSWRNFVKLKSAVFKNFPSLFTARKQKVDKKQITYLVMMVH